MDPTYLDMGMVNAPRERVMQTDGDVHEPFSRIEHFQQLKEIDAQITSLLDHSRRAIEALTKPAVHRGAYPDCTSATTTMQADAPDPTTKDFDPQAQFRQFKAAMYDFIATVDSVDKRLKRQMYGLEEAGILTLQRAGGGAGAAVANGGGNTASSAGGGGGGGEKSAASLDPDGMGRIGTLDVGRLNAGRATVECAMEAELWSRTRRHLEEVMSHLVQ